MTAFVAGATGYVGREVVRLLCAASIETTAHVRPGSGQGKAWSARFESMGARVSECAWQPDAIKAALAETGPKTVFALLGTTRRRAKAEAIEGDPYDRIDYGLTAMLYAAAIASGTEPRFIYLSAAGAGGGAARSNYMRARVRAERLICDGPLAYVIARPAIITGDDRDESRPGERIAGKAIDGALSLLGAVGAKKLKARYQSTTNTQLATALVRLALNSREAAVVAEGEALRAVNN